ncbi:MAG: TonB-dependent receptor domain-containing protein, partial [Terriglobia bacterium]
MTPKNQEPTLASLSHAIAAMLLLGFVLAVRASAQVVGATMSGTVVDTSGAVVPGVAIYMKNIATGAVTSAVTNAVGLYTAPNLQPGTYELTASANGFMTEVRTGITLTVGQERVMNLTLRVGGATQKVTVSAQAVTVNLANSTLGGVVNQTGVSQLPLNGRSWTDLATLQPGVTLVQDQAPISAGDRVKRGLGSQLEISGGRPMQNNYLLDGVNINDYANAGPGSVLGGNLGTDAVAEFSVLTTNYDTSYGRTSGGVVSAVTKSGTNQFHGDAYEFLRNGALDAANFFDNFANAAKPPFRRNQFGASAGGPIQKDKTFIFGDYEGIRQSLGSAVTDTVPSPAARAGNLTAGPVTVDPAAAGFLNAFYPLPNGPISGDTGLYEFDAFQITSENFFIIRADHAFSEKDHISTTYMFDFTPQNEPDEFKNKLIDNVTHRQVVAFEWNHIVSPDLMNSFRAGFNRDFTASPSGGTAVNPAVADPSFGFAPGTTAGAVNIGALTGFSGGLATAAPFEFHWNSWQGYDNVFYTRSNHSIKFGANIERIEDNTIGLNAPGGIMAFNSLSDFLTNHPASFIIDTPGTESPRGQRQTIFGAYFQDDIHLRSNLTVNAGLRYEMASVLTEVQGKLVNLRVMNRLPPKRFLGSPYIMNPTERNFEPRVGFAWDPFRNGKTAVRGGIGIFDILPLPVEMGPGVDSVVPFLAANTSSGVLPAGSFPTGAFSIVTASANNGRSSIIEFDPHRNYVAQWNL